MNRTIDKVRSKKVKTCYKSAKPPTPVTHANSPIGTFLSWRSKELFETLFVFPNKRNVESRLMLEFCV